MKKRKVYRGWIDPKDEGMLPSSKLRKNHLVTWIGIVDRPWSIDRPCTITVEWTEPKRRKQ